MKNITIGIPRALSYYKYKYIWTSFFKELGINILISPYTAEDMICKYDVCTSLNIFFGHVNYLVDKVDYVLVLRDINSCYYFNSIYDITNNIYETKILDFNIENSEEDAFINMGNALGFDKQTSLDAYKIAKKEEYKQRKINYLLQQRKLKKDNKKILIIGEDYIYEDEFIKKKVLKDLDKENIDLFYSNTINPDIKCYKNAIKDNINNLKECVNKCIYVSTNPCVYKKMLLSDKKYDLIININEDNSQKLNNFINNMENEYE